jgi:hypothetical protein
VALVGGLFRKSSPQRWVFECAVRGHPAVGANWRRCCHFLLSQSASDRILRTDCCSRSSTLHRNWSKGSEGFRSRSDSKVQFFSSASYFSLEARIRADGYPTGLPATGPIGVLVNNPAFRETERNYVTDTSRACHGAKRQGENRTRTRDDSNATTIQPGGLFD